MGNSLQPKKNNKKLIYIILVGFVSMVLLGIGLFYFYPIPKTLDKAVQSGASIERCLYSGGVGYFASFAGGDVNTKVFYKPNGTEICTAGGFTGHKLDGPCKEKICFPVYDN